MNHSESLSPSLLHTAAGSPAPDTSRPRLIATWLLVCCALVFAMVVLGGVTRLTGSGLSMVDWDPIMGVVPPLTEAEWEATFAKYRQFPEYQQKNIGMTVAEFKGIFWFEYAHRMLGRLIGLVFFLPFVYFWIRGYFNRRMVLKLVAMFVLGGLQGLLGWYMVMSGLVDRPHVSQYRLTAHLGAALVIYAYMFWVALGLLFPRAENSDAAMRRRTYGVAAFIFLVALSGGLVAGLKAGLAYNTFPMMGDEWFPSAYWNFQPAWINVFENIAAVQFNHRTLAELLLVIVLALWWSGRRREIPARARLGLNLMAGMVLVQVGLGIATLLLAVPVALGALHQAGALVLFTFALFTAQSMRT